MNSPILQLLVLAGIAVFLILRLRSVLGTRDGFEKPPAPLPGRTEARPRPDLEVIEGGPDRDITDHVADDSDAAKALTSMKAAEPSFNVTEFLGGARGAYEMILMAFESGELENVVPFLGQEVYETFAQVIDDRESRGLTVEATFVGIREIKLTDASFEADSNTGEVTVSFVGELTSVVRDNAGEIIEGSQTEIKRQRDTWTFAREMGADNPNWKLVATGQ